MEKTNSKKEKGFVQAAGFTLAALITLTAVLTCAGCKQSAKGGKPTEFTLTIRGDERISISAPAFITVKPDQTWATVKMQIASKVTLKSGQDQAEYGIYEWRLNDEDGNPLTDKYVFTQNETVYALTNYTNAKWKTEGSKLIGYNGDKPRGNIIIPDEINGTFISEIAKDSFYTCRELTGVDLSYCTELTKIGMMSFGGCRGLTYVKLPETLEIIDVSAFFNCKKLMRINFPEDIKEIRNHAFYGCNSMKLFDFLQCINLTKIGWEAFKLCNAKYRIEAESELKNLLLKCESDITDTQIIEK